MTCIYDSVSNIIRQTTSGDTDVDLTYKYTRNGEISAEKRTEAGRTITSAYTYDALGQIKTFNTTDYAERYTYDTTGNMLEK